MRNMRNPTDWSKAPLELTIKNPPADKKELNDFSLPLGKTDPSNSWITPDPASKGEGKIDLEAFKTGGHPFNPQPGGAKFKPVPPGLGGTEFKPVPPGLGGAEFKPVPGPVGGVTIKFLEQSGN
jgi:hypothetical protein